jgi:hypothetical protein
MGSAEAEGVKGCSNAMEVAGGQRKYAEAQCRAAEREQAERRICQPPRSGEQTISAIVPSDHKTPITPGVSPFALHCSDKPIEKRMALPDECRSGNAGAKSSDNVYGAVSCSVQYRQKRAEAKGSARARDQPDNGGPVKSSR